MTASSRINSHTDLNRIDETLGNITVEGGDLLVNERKIDRQTHTHNNRAPWLNQRPHFFTLCPPYILLRQSIDCCPIISYAVRHNAAT